MNRRNNYKKGNKNVKSVRGKLTISPFFSAGSSLKSSCVISNVKSALLI